MKSKNLKVSLVIPVYNEATLLPACLNAVMAQKTKPYEVIVVDNNSVDHTREVALCYPGVKVITAHKQGVVHARTLGFDEAKGDIIARIDADTILPSDWIGQIIDIFNKHQYISALSGSVDYYDFTWMGLAAGVDRFVRRFLEKRLGDRLYLLGANMAMRKKDWLNVKDGLCVSSGMHEDLDLAIHLQEKGHKVAYIENLEAGLSARRLDSGFLAFVRYTLVSPATYKRHNLKRRVYMYPFVLLCWILYGPGRFIYHCFDSESNSYSLKAYLLNRYRKDRVDPTVNVVL